MPSRNTLQVEFWLYKSSPLSSWLEMNTPTRMWNYRPRYRPWEKTLVFNLATCCYIAEHSLNCKPYAMLAKEILNCMEVKIISLEVSSKIKWKVECSALF